MWLSVLSIVMPSLIPSALTAASPTAAPIAIPPPRFWSLPMNPLVLPPASSMCSPALSTPLLTGSKNPSPSIELSPLRPLLKLLVSLPPLRAPLCSTSRSVLSSPSFTPRSIPPPAPMPVASAALMNFPLALCHLPSASW